MPGEHALAHAADGLEQQHRLGAGGPLVDERQLRGAAGEALPLEIGLAHVVEGRRGDRQVVVGARRRLCCGSAFEPVEIGPKLVKRLHGLDGEIGVAVE